jgi:hypothetical protein
MVCSASPREDGELPIPVPSSRTAEDREMTAVIARV